MSELVSYIETCRRCPRQAVKEIAACALILAAMFGALYLKEILLWIGGAL
jgi:hypothetical protein